MMKRILVAAAIAAVCAWPTTASAQADLTLTPFAGVSFGGNLDTTRTAYGATLGFTVAAIGLDLDFGVTPNFFGKTANVSGSNALTVMGNVKLAPAIRSRGVKPYVSGGIGLIRTRVDANQVFDNISSNDWGLNLGFGVGGYFTPHVGLQGDVRYFRAFHDVDVRNVNIDLSGFDFWRTSLGLSFKF